MGDFEASVDAVLYSFDAEYRRRAKLRELDSSFGASLKRLRLERGLTQKDLGVDERTVRRIEANEVQPQKRTLKMLAERLDVAPEEIADW